MPSPSYGCHLRIDNHWAQFSGPRQYGARCGEERGGTEHGTAAVRSAERIAVRSVAVRSADTGLCERHGLQHRRPSGTAPLFAFVQSDVFVILHRESTHLWPRCQ